MHVRQHILPASHLVSWLGKHHFSLFIGTCGNAINRRIALLSISVSRDSFLSIHLALVSVSLIKVIQECTSHDCTPLEHGNPTVYGLGTENPRPVLWHICLSHLVRLTISVFVPRLFSSISGVCPWLVSFYTCVQASQLDGSSAVLCMLFDFTHRKEKISSLPSLIWTSCFNCLYYILLEIYCQAFFEKT